jgi:hypothetical protein
MLELRSKFSDQNTVPRTTLDRDVQQPSIQILPQDDADFISKFNDPSSHRHRDLDFPCRNICEHLTLMPTLARDDCDLFTCTMTLKGWGDIKVW